MYTTSLPARWITMLLLLPCAGAFADQASPTVNLTLSGYTLYSSGTAYYSCDYNTQFSPCVASGYHNIIDGGTGTTGASATFSQNVGWGDGSTVYDNTLNAGSAGGDCYQANVSVSGTNLATGAAGASNRVTSGSVCAPLPAPPPPSSPPQVCNAATDGTCESPLVLNLGTGGYELSGSADPVSFDLDANGVAERITWTARAAPMAFLALDRNGNGVVDDGSELFGNHTPLPLGGIASNGFVALAAYDSNGDGVIDASDPIWPGLLLWVDANHDGVCQPEEVSRVADSGISALELSSQWSGRRDVHGNTFRFEALYRRGGQLRPYYDIYFVRLP